MSNEQRESTDTQPIATSAPQEDQQTQQSIHEDGLPNSQQNPVSLPCRPKQSSASSEDSFAEVFMNMALYDPPRWGWTALGGISDVLTPHERSRRYSTCRTYKSKKRTRRRLVGTKGTETSLHSKDPPSLLTPVPTQSEPTSSQHITMMGHRPISSSKALSFSAPTTSQSISENPKQQQEPKIIDRKDSNSESKTTKVSSTTTIPQQISRNKAHTVGGNDSSSSRQEQPQERQEASVDTESKIYNTLDSEKQTAQPTVKRKEMIEITRPQPKKSDVLPKEKPIIDVGLETIGISTSVLGMTIQKQGTQQSTPEENNGANDKVEHALKKEADSNTSGRRSKKYGKSKSRRSTSGVVTRTKYDCHVRSLGISSKSLTDDADENLVDTKNTKGMVLDVFAYHQGREGMEPRDAETGELLCTQQATDTNHDFDAPKSTFPMHIEFPLEDEVEGEADEDYTENSDSNSKKRLDCDNQYFENESAKDNKHSTVPTTTEKAEKSSRKKNVAMYRETLAWDLLDPNTPTPLAFASSLGSEYGLSFGQTMDLAAMIDKQIHKHVTETSQYREPIATMEPTQELTQSRKLGPVRQPYRFDEVLQTQKEGGTFKPKRDRRMNTKNRSTTISAGVTKKTKPGRSSLAAPEVAATVKTPSSEKCDKAKKTAVKISDLSLEDEIDDKLLDEVRRRTSMQPVFGENRTTSVLKPEKNAICHICKKRMPMGYHFPCSGNNHVYCDSHVQNRLGLTKESGVYKHDSCPICTLTCECAKCIRKLKNVATLLKAKSIEQRKQPHEVDFPGILSSCKNMISNKELARATDLVLKKKLKEIRRKREAIEGQKQQKRESLDKDPDKICQQQSSDFESVEKSPGKKSRTVLRVGQTMVPRPPLSAFPRELHGGIDFDARATAAYFTAYSSDGIRSVNDVPDVWLDEERAKPGVESSQLSKIKSTSEVQEDGNVDYCHICKTAGHLILCDYCPRGFHQDCLRNDNRLSPDGDHWECFVCKNEKITSDKHFVDGKESIDVISPAFLELDPTDERVLVGLEVLSIIHQMLTNLNDYDFGYIFSKPVDVSLVPGYEDVVKCPMDIGTICSKLVNGEFSKLLKGNFSMDDLVTKVLNDIELIWRNCIMFNVIGSSVARMALVLRRRVKMICRRSIFPKLSDEVKKNVLNYARKFDEAWASGITASFDKESDDSMSANNWKLSAIANLQPKSDLNFSAKPTNGRSIAILDSVSGRVVKLYSSAKSASKAVELILKSGHRCEWNANASRTDLNLKLIAEKSKSDPNSLLFGYRWLFLDDLDAGNAAFLKTVDDFIEMRYGEYTFVFRSIEEALSSFQLSKTVDINIVRKKLAELPRDGNWVEMDRLNWRRPLVHNKGSDHLKSSDSIPIVEEIVEPGPNLVSDSDSLPSWKSCAFLKKDLVTDQFLVGFDSIQLAHKDWMQSALSSPSFPSSEAQTMENFRKHYLDGDRNIDGMIWQTGENGRRMERDNQKENTNNENAANVMEVQGDGTGEHLMSESKTEVESIMLSKIRESTTKSSINEPSTPSLNAVSIANNQRIVSTDPSATGKLEDLQRVSGKRKYMDDDNGETDFSANKEARLSVIFVESDI